MTLSRPAKSELPVILFDRQKSWKSWLGKNFASSAGVWLKLAKKSADLQSVSYQQALDIALCYGWIDGQKKSGDKSYWLQKFTPRGPKSIWSKINRAKAKKLIAGGYMQAPGLAAIERAKANGRWQAAYDSHRTARLPEDFRQALNHNNAAKAFFSTLNSQNRYAILFRIQTAKKIETRQKRIAQFIAMLEKQEKLYP